MLSRRGFVRSGVIGAAALTAGELLPLRMFRTAALIGNAYPGARLREFTLTAAVGRWEVARDSSVSAWMFNNQLPGPELRVTEGDVIRVTLRNQLPDPTTIHWHGMPVPFVMDGVPELTQPPVPPGKSFVYEFVARTPGTYWYHSHVAYQIERGLFGALIVEPRRESLSYDREYTLVLDDWVNDVDHATPSAAPYNMRVAGALMGSMRMEMDDHAGEPALEVAASQQSGAAGSTGQAALHGAPRREPVFDRYTINGGAKPSEPLLVRRGERVRLRLVNASAATVVPMYLAGHRLTITHLDGQPVVPRETGVVVIGMGERVDVIFEANNQGAWPLASADSRQRQKGMEIVVRYDGVGIGTAPSDTEPPRISPTPYRDLEGLAELRPVEPHRTYDLVFAMDSATRWTVNGKAYPDVEPLKVSRGERIRLRLRNESMFAHPIHLHGHFFDVVRPYGAMENIARPLRKDTITLYHMDSHAIEFTADNPGARWFLHCHNQYHHSGGMATEVRYV
jgi:FtsP/CotA-like multicopper oxidase with cupredoxin domain